MSLQPKEIKRYADIISQISSDELKKALQYTKNTMLGLGDGCAFGSMSYNDEFDIRSKSVSNLLKKQKIDPTEVSDLLENNLYWQDNNDIYDIYTMALPLRANVNYGTLLINHLLANDTDEVLSTDDAKSIAEEVITRLKIRKYSDMILTSNNFTPKVCKLALNYAKSYAKGERQGCNFLPDYDIRDDIEEFNEATYRKLEPILNEISKTDAIDQYGIIDKLACDIVWENVYEDSDGEASKGHSCGVEFIRQLLYFINRYDSNSDLREMYFISSHAFEIFKQVQQAPRNDQTWSECLWYNRQIAVATTLTLGIGIASYCLG
ncbi:hypothetical protein L3V82_02035 [Thiotrichales bacterium 19S3-7]|nr:hypothetical protein [Thiotrichales bacterium 19S3-7]MCF6800945.1 hypothetical protein [Thiotrichales bacterium 19S3-11]